MVQMNLSHADSAPCSPNVYNYAICLRKFKCHANSYCSNPNSNFDQ